MKIYCFVTGLFFIFFLTRCHQHPQADEGETLAKIHCASCHAYPEPALLDRLTWEKYVLPRMGIMTGVLPADSAGVVFIEPEIRDEAFQNPNVFRREATLSKDQWAAIQQFYLKNAPETLEIPNEPVLDSGLQLFHIQFPDYFLSPPSTTLVKIFGNQLLVGDANSRRLYRYDKNLELNSFVEMDEGAVCFNTIPEGNILTSMGSFSPSDRPLGKLIFFPKQERQPPLTLLDSLRRPVHTALADLNADGRFDLITCEFGKWTGSLSWWKNHGNGHFVRQVLRNMPGAIRSVVKDFNADGLPDIITLFGQGNEGIFMFLNKGNDQFEETNVLRFPPSYGSSYFELLDYNGDGFDDIIYTAGDNADYPPVVKPYHGIRIFQNDGANHFREIFFYALPGAYKAIPADFDLDGDLDIAAISFFPDFKKAPALSFVFLENQGKDQFVAYTFSSRDKGRWIVMDAGDLDGDGDLDLVLGSLAFEVVPDGGQIQQWIKDGIPFVLLENKVK